MCVRVHVRVCVCVCVRERERERERALEVTLDLVSLQPRSSFAVCLSCIMNFPPPLAARLSGPLSPAVSHFLCLLCLSLSVFYLSVSQPHLVLSLSFCSSVYRSHSLSLSLSPPPLFSSSPCLWPRPLFICTSSLCSSSPGFSVLLRSGALCFSLSGLCFCVSLHRVLPFALPLLFFSAFASCVCVYVSSGLFHLLSLPVCSLTLSVCLSCPLSLRVSGCPSLPVCVCVSLAPPSLPPLFFFCF